MRCPTCGAIDQDKVIDSRLTEGGLVIRRRRECEKCNRRFTTKERLEEELRLMVVKNGGERVPYNRDNILTGVAKACYKLPIEQQQIETLVDRVEEELLHNHDRLVTTEQIGSYVGDQLRRLHPVAYVRFMSVHRKYNSVDEFVDEIREVRERVAQESPNQKLLFEAPT